MGAANIGTFSQDDSEFSLNEEGIEELARSTEMTSALFITGQDLAEAVKSFVPERSTPKTGDKDNSADPGEMRDSIVVVPDDEIGVVVAAMDWRFHWLEFGTGLRENRYGADRGEMPASAPFRRAIEASNLDFHPGREG